MRCSTVQCETLLRRSIYVLLCFHIHLLHFPLPLLFPLSSYPLFPPSSMCPSSSLPTSLTCRSPTLPPALLPHSPLPPPQKMSSTSRKETSQKTASCHPPPEPETQQPIRCFRPQTSPRPQGWRGQSSGDRPGHDPSPRPPAQRLGQQWLCGGAGALRPDQLQR